MDYMNDESSAWLSDDEGSPHYDPNAEDSDNSDRLQSEIEIELYGQLHHSESLTSSLHVQNKSIPEIDFTPNTHRVSFSKSPVDARDDSNGNSEKLIHKSSVKNSKKRKKEVTIKKKTKTESHKEIQNRANSNSDNSIICIDSDDCNNPGRMLSNSCQNLKGHKDAKKIKHYKYSMNDNEVCLISSSDESETSPCQPSNSISKASALHCSTPISGTPENGNLWHVDTDDFYVHVKPQARYHESQNTVCNNCKKKGHMVMACEEPRKVSCYICGGNHPWIGCKNQVCGKCNRNGHLSKYCRLYSWEIFCELCNLVGHTMQGCPDLWRRYHMTTTPGAIIKADNGGGEEGKAKYCYNCGQKGHFGHICPKPRMMKDVYPTWPFVISYTDPHRSDQRSRHGQMRQRGEEEVRHSQRQYSSTTPHGRETFRQFHGPANGMGSELSNRQKKKTLVTNFKPVNHQFSGRHTSFDDPHYPRDPAPKRKKYKKQKKAYANSQSMCF